MKGTPVPEPVKELIITRIKNGEKVDELAKEFSLYPNTIRKWLRGFHSSSNFNQDGSSGGSNNNHSTRTKSDALLISKLQREKQELLEIIGELTVLTKQSKKKSS